MSVGAVIAITAWGLLVVGVLYGLSHDVRRWRKRRRQERRMRALLARADSEWRMAEWDRKIAPWRWEWEAARLKHLDVYRAEDWLEPEREAR